jgi:hypothetical protein
MDDRKPDISLIDLPHSEIVPTEYLRRQCAVFMEIKKGAGTVSSAMTFPTRGLPEGALVVVPRVHACKSIINQNGHSSLPPVLSPYHVLWHKFQSGAV